MEEKKLMVYWVLDNKGNKPNVCTSLKAIQQVTRMKYDTLTYTFSRKKRTTYKNDEIWIEKVELIRSKRKNK